MSVKLLCPECESISTAPDEILGETVRCEECNSLFTAKIPIRRQLLEDDNDVYDHPHSRRMLAKTGTDPRPFRIGVKLLGGCSLLIFGALLLFVLAVFLTKPEVAARKRDPVPPWIINGGIPAVQTVQGVQKIRISNARLGGGDKNDPFGGDRGDFTFDFEFLDRHPAFGQFYVRCRYSDGSTAEAHMGVVGIMDNRGTLSITSFGGQKQQRVEIWIEESEIAARSTTPRTSVSNLLALN